MTNPIATPSLPVLTVQDGVAVITLNRPAQRNRLENEDLAALLVLFSQINQDPSVRVLVLTANTQDQAQPVFCAGYDIGGFNEAGHGAMAFEKVPQALAELRPVTICALNGSVYGGATDLVLACDLRIALQGVQWRMPAAALGLHYYPSGLRRYVSLFGEQAAKRAFLTARPFSIEQLQALGLFEAVCSVQDWQATLQDLIDDIVKLAPLAVQETKRSIREIASGEYHLGRLQAREALTSQSEDFAEGRAAFTERRTPVFKGQ
jgi:1,4-dihydroxy-2-naphthoyl-CoA synthase